MDSPAAVKRGVFAVIIAPPFMIAQKDLATD